MLMKQLGYSLEFHGFVYLSANEAVWHPTVFTKNPDRLLEGAVAEQFFLPIVAADITVTIRLLTPPGNPVYSCRNHQLTEFITEPAMEGFGR
jgi:hypothetical protein